VIPKEWLKDETTVEEVESITVLDREGLDESMVVEKGNPWWRRSVYKELPSWIAFKQQLQEGDILYKWSAPLRAWGFNGNSGFAIVRNDEILFIYTEPPR
jgi:hypothetical protein